MADATEHVNGLGRASELTIYPHVFEHADREVGGVLIGRAPAGEGLPLVTAAIPAIAADEQRATLTFTQDAWEHVHRVLDREHPGKQIVGWYHSHPGFGIFLSEHDLFIHRNFFSGRGQIALVIDPLAGLAGVFCWRDDDVVSLYERPTGEGWVGLGSAPAAPAPAPRRPRIELHMEPDPRPYPIAIVIAAVVVGLSIGLLGARFAFGEDAPQPSPTVTPVTTIAPGPTVVPATPEQRTPPGNPLPEDGTRRSS